MRRLIGLGSLLLAVGCGAPIYHAKLGRFVTVNVVSQSTVQRECYKRGVGLHPALAYPLLTVLLGCTAWDEQGKVTVFSVDSAGALLHELDHAFNNKRCHDLLGRPATC